jgi:hypothetical protein
MKLKQDNRSRKARAWTSADDRRYARRLRREFADFWQYQVVRGPSVAGHLFPLSKLRGRRSA